MKKLILNVFYNIIRDTPYTMDYSGVSWDWFKGIVMKKGYGCSRKHYLLARLLQNINIPFAFLIFPFYWHELPVIPEALRERAQKVPMNYHLALSVLINGNQLLLDITWDKSLKEAGLPINSFSAFIGGKSSLAVNPYNAPLVHSTRIDRDQFIGSVLTQRADTFSIAEIGFYDQLNNWLRRIRK